MRRQQHSRPKGGRHKRRKRSNFARAGRSDSSMDTTYRPREGKTYDRARPGSTAKKV